jgi:hypothetical protein
LDADFFFVNESLLINDRMPLVFSGSANFVH